jgi:hypothetical protein
MSEKEEFCLSVQSDMHPGRDTFETVSSPIPPNHTLYLSSLVVACDPKCDGEVANCLQVDVLWREHVNGEDVDHPVDVSVWANFAETRAYDKQSRCLDGTAMIGDGKKKLVIRRHVEGLIGPQNTAVVVRGHCY